MATPPKAKLIEKLKALGFTPPADASSGELQKLLKQARALSLPRQAPERPPRPAVPPPAAAMPPAPAQRPSFGGSGPLAMPRPGRPLAAPAVPPRPAPRSDREARPWDPFAGA